MQRLFSMFPAGSPGVALFLLRVALAAMLMDSVEEPDLQLGPPGLLAPGAVAIALLFGFLTPIVAMLCVVFQVALWIAASEAIEAVHACAILIGVALALLGPGAFSLDARLFGRRQVILRSHDDSAQ